MKKLNLKRTMLLAMVTIICLCGINPVYADYSVKQKEAFVGFFTKVAKSVMEVRQEESKDYQHSYNYVVKTFVTDKKDQYDPSVASIFQKIIDDAYYNFEESMTPMGKQREINKFTNLWYVKLCGIVGLKVE